MSEKKSLVKWATFELKNKRFVKELANRPAQDMNYAYQTFRKDINGRSFLSTEEVNRIIAEKINNKEPFWAGRMGWVEMDMVRQVIQHDMVSLLDHRVAKVESLYRQAGFFPQTVEAGDKFGHLILEEAKGIDLQGFWDLYMEDYLLKEYQNTQYIAKLSQLEPWNLYFENDKNQKKLAVKPWSSALKGKKVLVIHPFADTIKKQYEENRKHIFERIYEADDILPEFELITLKAVQTMGNTTDGRFDTWFDALDYMSDSCEKTDFDVAIIGCGAYGYPLAARIKRMGKVAIHLGGATQLMFGIRGNRWETTHIGIKNTIMNDYWVRPKAEEKPKDADSVEEGCYW